MKTANILYILLIVQIATLLAVVFNVFAARQFLGFIYLSFLPGFLLLKLFKLEEIGFVETILFSVGASLAFLMLFGLLLNTSSAFFSLLNPLSTFPIVTTLSTSVSVMYFLFCVKRKDSSGCSLPDFKIPSIAFLLVSMVILTILGTELARIYNNPFVLMLLVIVVCLVVIGAFWKEVLPVQLYPLAIVAISFFLLFHVALISNLIIGADVHAEYFFAQLTAVNSFWDRAVFHPYNSMLSVTILPTIFSIFLNVDMDWIFKLFYPIVYLLVPLSLYYVYQRQTSSHLIAFVSVFFFMSIDVFFNQMLGLNRQIIAELFLALLILLMFEDRISPLKRQILFFFLSWALIVSHYSVAYLFAFFLLANLFLLDLFRSTVPSTKQTVQLASNKYMVLGYVLMIFAWNLLFTKASYDAFSSFLNYLYNSIVSPTPGGAYELTSTYLSPLHEVSRYLFYLPQILIVIGVIALLTKRKEKLFDSEFSTMSIASLIIVLMCIFLPSFSKGLNMTRFYHLSLFFLAPFPFIGGIFLFDSVKSWLFRTKNRIVGVRRAWNKKHILLLVTVIVICVFLFQIGFPYELANDIPNSVPLSMNRIDDWSLNMHQLFMEQSEVSSARWLMKRADNGLKVYADIAGFRYLNSYGSISGDRLRYIDPQMINQTVYSSYLYFDEVNVVLNRVSTYGGLLNATDFSLAINQANHVYSNGGNDIYYGGSW